MTPYGLSCLIVDYGGVLTTSVQGSFDTWADAVGVDRALLARVMRELLTEGAAPNAVHALERGEMGVPEFERHLADLLRAPGDAEVVAAGLLSKAFGALQSAGTMVAAVGLAKAAGIRTALLSNSWGLDYDRQGWDTLFDAVVISGEVGLRKPEPEIYRLTADRLGCRPAECVFVDDLSPNVRGAVAAGMVGVLHTDVECTLDELEVLLGVRLRAPG